MFWLSADLLRHAAPTELETLMERPSFYKHFAFKKLLSQVARTEEGSPSPRPSPPGEGAPRTRGWFPLLGERVRVRAEYYLPLHRLLGESFFHGTARKAGAGPLGLERACATAKIWNVRSPGFSPWRASADRLKPGLRTGILPATLSASLPSPRVKQEPSSKEQRSFQRFISRITTWRAASIISKSVAEART